VAGPASRSYGVEVARLAGVPAAVVERARVLLAGLEAGAGPGHQPVTAPVAQLPLFASRDEQLRRQLATLEPERLTPLEALTTLAQLVEAARRGV